jgi:hypothetical protein
MKLSRAKEIVVKCEQDEEVFSKDCLVTNNRATEYPQQGRG